MVKRGFTLVFSLLVLLFLVLIFLRQRQYRPQVHKYLLMDTEVDIVLPARRGYLLKQLLPMVNNMISSLDFYDSSSCVSKLNKDGRIGAEDVCYPIMKEVIEESKSVWRDTDGAFDPGFRGECSVGDININQRAISVDGSQGRCVFDFSGIAKGYIVDRMIDFLASASVEYAMVNAGGDIRSYRKDSIPVIVQIRNPYGKRPFDKIFLGNYAVATSGNYERGRHIIDPSTRRAVEQLISASAAAKSCAIADAWATALFVLGKKGLDTAEEKGIGAMIVCGPSNTDKPNIKANNKWRALRL